ncbi:MAG: SDR family NAD(P)-dependent oxidoreductase [Gammaproteobacteria bacterium]
MNQSVAVITGAANGLGLALATQCAQDNMLVVMLDKDESQLTRQVARLQNELNASIHGIVCDVTQADQLTHAANTIYERYQKINLLINNAGIFGSLAPVWTLDTDQVQRVLDVNIFGVLHSIQAFLPLMLKQSQESHVVNMASLYGLCSGSQISAYTMSKHALIALSESLYFDLQHLKKPIHVSVVCPSFINTNLLDNAVPASDPKHTILKRIMEYSHSPDTAAKSIMSQIQQKLFYILPNEEVKQYCEQRTQAIINQTLPHEHRVEKIFKSLV